MDPTNLPAFLQPRSVREHQDQQPNPIAAAGANNGNNRSKKAAAPLPTAVYQPSDDDSDDDDDATGGGLDFGAGDDSQPKVQPVAPSSNSPSTSTSFVPGYRPESDAYAHKPQHVFGSGSTSAPSAVKQPKGAMVSSSTSTGVTDGAGGYGALSPSHHNASPNSPKEDMGANTDEHLTAASTGANSKINKASSSISDPLPFDPDADNDDDLPPDFDEDLLAEDDPNEDDEQYRMRMADELAPICEGMSHDEIVSLLDDYAQQRKERRRALMEKKEAAERHEKMRRMLTKTAVAPTPTANNELDVEHGGSSSKANAMNNSAALGANNPNSSSGNATMMGNLGALMFGEVDAELAAKGIAPLPPTPTPPPAAASSSATTKGNGQQKRHETAPSTQPALSADANVDINNNNKEAFYAPPVAEARMQQQLDELLGEFEANRQQTAEEMLRQQRESAGGILAARRNSWSRSSLASGGGGTTVAKGRGGSIMKTSATPTGRGGGALGDDGDDDDDDLLCVTGGLAAKKPSSSAAVSSTPTKRVSVMMPASTLPRQPRVGSAAASSSSASGTANTKNSAFTGALSSDEGSTSASADKAFKARAAAMCSVPRQAPDAHATPEKKNSTADAALSHKNTSNNTNNSKLPAGSAAMVARKGSNASIGSSSSSATPGASSMPLSRHLTKANAANGAMPIPLPPSSALAMPPPPQLTSDAGKKAAAAMQSGPSVKPAVLKRATPTPPSIPSTSSSTVQARKSVGGSVGGVDGGATNVAKAYVPMSSNQHTPPPQQSVVASGGFNFFSRK